MRSAAGLVAAGGGLPAPHDVFGGIDVGGGFGGGGGGFVGSGGGSSFSWKSILGVAALGAAIGFGEWAKTKAAKKNKRRAAELIAFQGLDQILTTFENYTRWQMDFDSALSNVQSTWADMLKGWRELGRKYLKKYQGLHQGKYDQIIGDLKRIEGIRQQRLFSMSLIGVPEFETGGMVRQITAHNGRLLAILHEGEAVLNRGAVQQLGPQVIEQINRGGTSAPSFEHGGLVGGAAAARGDVHIEVNITPAPGMNEEQLARYTIRKLRRELKDRGLQLGG